MKDAPKVGDFVSLNDRGIEIIGGLRSAEMMKAARRMRITEVGDDMCSDIPTYVICVDAPLINVFMITNHDVDLLPLTQTQEQEEMKELTLVTGDKLRISRNALAETVTVDLSVGTGRITATANTESDALLTISTRLTTLAQLMAAMGKAKKGL